MNNPRFWASQWYTTKFSDEPWPGGWYWHDQHHNWFGPFDGEHDAVVALKAHLEAERQASDVRQRTHPQFQLYYHPLSTYSQKVLIAIQEKGAPFERKIVNLMDEQERDEYRKLYPLGKIPLIVLNHGPLIPESSIIIEYLDSLGGPRLISDNPDVARKTRFKDRLFDFYLGDSLGVLIFEGMKPEGERDEKKMETARYRIGAVYDFMEHEVSGNAWANGEDFSLSDCSAAAALLYARMIIPYSDYPNISAYAERLDGRPSVRQVREEAAPYIEVFQKRRAG